ncbi:MAG TPA: ATP synthase subunit I [Desulfobacteraceae bacterium]|nr:ATP synthase subunit I [Desulfobacteraceae bacterium]
MIAAVFAGAALGCFYFTGLWWTLKRLPSARRPVMLNTVSFLLRMAVALTGFYLILGGGWRMLTASLLGFIAVRVLLVRRLGPE